MKKHIIYIILALFSSAYAAQAQTASMEMPTVIKDSLNISIVNCYPGNEIYELDGHAAMHVSGIIGGEKIDAAVNYGVFDFSSPNFVYRFVKGETDYRVGAYPWKLFLLQYAKQGRTVEEYPLNLTQEQKTELYHLLAENLRPENSTYRYNYVKDNCSTRIFGIIEKAAGKDIEMTMPETEREESFRDVMRRYHAHYPWYQFGIDLALGPGIDYPITAREHSFAPAELPRLLPYAKFTDGSPLTTGMEIAHQGQASVIDGPTPWYLTPTTVFWVLFVIVALITIRDLRSHSVSRWLDAILFGAFGLAGCLIAFLVFVSLHEATSPNWLLLWLNPLCLIVPLLIWLKKCKKVVFSYIIINFALTLALLLMYPFTGQAFNPAFLPLTAIDLLRSASYIIINKSSKNG